MEATTRDQGVLQEMGAKAPNPQIPRSLTSAEPCGTHLWPICYFTYFSCTSRVTTTVTSGRGVGAKDQPHVLRSVYFQHLHGAWNVSA